ncbi:MAG: hypothetical protein NTX50_32280 [Candidatus Sumerlaeota bacterium]|nr:hypothetical protein [Candidatus Sumerlaeota bacterium]
MESKDILPASGSKALGLVCKAGAKFRHFWLAPLPAFAIPHRIFRLFLQADIALFRFSLAFRPSESIASFSVYHDAARGKDQPMATQHSSSASNEAKTIVHRFIVLLGRLGIGILLIIIGGVAGYWLTFLYDPFSSRNQILLKMKQSDEEEKKMLEVFHANSAKQIDDFKAELLASDEKRRMELSGRDERYKLQLLEIAEKIKAVSSDIEGKFTSLKEDYTKLKEAKIIIEKDANPRDANIQPAPVVPGAVWDTTATIVAVSATIANAADSKKSDFLLSLIKNCPKQFEAALKNLLAPPGESGILTLDKYKYNILSLAKVEIENELNLYYFHLSFSLNDKTADIMVLCVFKEIQNGEFTADEKYCFLGIPINPIYDKDISQLPKDVIEKIKTRNNWDRTKMLGIITKPTYEEIAKNVADLENGLGADRATKQKLIAKYLSQFAGKTFTWQAKASLCEPPKKVELSQDLQVVSKTPPFYVTRIEMPVFVYDQWVTVLKTQAPDDLGLYKYGIIRVELDDRCRIKDVYVGKLLVQPIY